MSKVIGLRGGHSSNLKGSSGIVDEYTEMQRFYQAVSTVLEKYGYTIINCNSNANTESGELSEGITKSNNANADLFISLHMNAFDGSAHGTEMWVKDESSEAYSISQNLVSNFAKLGFANRGVKTSTDFYEMNHSNCPNIISEICFCDSQTDMDIIYKYTWEQLAYVFCNAIDSKIPTDAKDDTSSTSNNTSVNDTLNLNNLIHKDENGNIIDEAKSIQNTITATTDLTSTYGIRQEIITKNSNEDPVITARRTLNDSCKPTEEIEVECFGDIMYRVGFGVHVILPFLPSYEDCFMYIKEVSNEWKDNGIFISSLTLTPSRVMDEQEWADDTSIEEDSSSGSSNSDLANKIIALLKQQLGKSYVWSSHGTDTFDCSGLVEYCYNQYKDELGITIGWTTYDQVKQGTEVDKTNKDEWQPADLLFWTGKDTPPSHVSVYLGNNQMIHAPQTGDIVKIVDITRTDIYAVRRVIPEVVSTGDDRSSSSGFGGIPNSYIDKSASYVDDKINVFLSNMKEYGYKDYIINISKEKGVDPYVTAGIIVVESEGNPNCGGNYPGLMQVTNGSSDAKTNIAQGLDEYNEKKSAVNSEQVHVILSAYNSGQGTVFNAIKGKDIDLSTCGIKVLGDALYDYCKNNSGAGNAEEKQYYSSRVLYACNVLKGKGSLN